jgi:hypothetical protein
MQAFGWNPEYIRKGITGAQGWAYYAWATAQESAKWMQPPSEPKNGYVSQEIERIKNVRRA